MKKCWQHFQKNIDEKILSIPPKMWMEKYCEQFQNNIYKKIMNEDKPV
jgi:hypothetical protein